MTLPFVNFMSRRDCFPKKDLPMLERNFKLFSARSIGNLVFLFGELDQVEQNYQFKSYANISGKIETFLLEGITTEISI